jgi:phosphoglycolate phosphatase
VQVGFDDPEPVRFEELRKRFLDIYRGGLANATRPFEGFDQVLASLERNGLAWGIVTNKPGWLTEPLLEAIGLLARAGCVVSGDTLPERKPHPRPLLHAASLLGLEPAACVYVGDAERDVQAAIAAGMTPIVATFGYLGERDDPAAWGAEALIDRPIGLLEWLSLGTGERPV